MSVDIEERGPVRILRWDDGENRMNPDSMAELDAALDHLESIEGPLAFVLTGTGKFFSNGLDLDRFATAPEELGVTAHLVHLLLGRMLLFPAYTVAAINGHAFAAGAMLSQLLRRAGHAQRPRLLVSAGGGPRAAVQPGYGGGGVSPTSGRGGPGRDAHRPPVRRRGGVGARDRDRDV